MDFRLFQDGHAVGEDTRIRLQGQIRVTSGRGGKCQYSRIASHRNPGEFFSPGMQLRLMLSLLNASPDEDDGCS